MSFTINGQKYDGAKYDFNTHCEFDAMGVNPLMLKANPLPVIRAYLSISSGLSLAESGNELEQHIIKGGKLTEIITALAKEMNDSAFFTAITKEMTESPEKAESQAKTKRVKTTKKNA